MRNIAILFKRIYEFLKQMHSEGTYKPTHRVVEILQNENGEYTIKVQLIGKNAVLNMKPEDILADDTLVDLFSPRDIRTLTYLGYLGINSPKYKILSQKLLENDSIIFALKKTGNKEVIIKTAAEIVREKEIIDSMSPNDAKTVGYNAATENQINHKINEIMLNHTPEKLKG